LSKSLGENLIKDRSLMWNIVRTSWLYGKYGNNFVKKIIDLSKNNSTITVTTEEFGSPTYALDLSKAIINIVETNINGVYHLSNEGQVNRFEFAKFILKKKMILFYQTLMYLMMELRDPR
jgi:dTDP-4-dehydrorhamnose reductase